MQETNDAASGRPDHPEKPVPHTSVRTVCFDLGGVVIRVCRSWEQVCERAGVPFRPEMFEPERMAALRRTDERHQLGRISGPEFHRAFSEALGGVYSAEEAERIHDAWLLGEYAGILDVIKELHVQGFETGCLSNTNARHWEMMTADRIAYPGETPPSGNGRVHFPAFHALRHRVASHELGLAKPDPAIYRAFEHAARVRPEQILFFDDLEANIGGALACGWRAHLVGSEDPVGAIRSALLLERLL